MNKDQLKGSAKEMGGKAQKAFGKAVDSPKHEVKGTAKETEGKLQKNWGEAKENTRERDESMHRNEPSGRRH